MKKWLILIATSLVVIVITITTLLPFGLGLIVQHKYAEVLQNWSQSENVKIKLVRYQRGWFHSNAVVQVALKYPALLQINQWLGNPISEDGIQLTLNQRIDHGPLLWISSQGGKSRLLLGRAAVKSHVKTLLGDIDSITFAQLDGSLLSAINAPNLRMDNAEKSINATLTGLTATFLLSSDLNQMFASIDVPQAAITTSDFLQQINNLSEAFSLRKSPSGLFLGWRTTKIGDTSWQTLDHKSQITLSGITMQSQSAEQNAKITYKLNTILDKLILDKDVYGPHQIKLTLSNLDVPTLIALRKELTQISGAAALSATQLLNYNDLFMLLLSKGLEMNVDKLNLALASGQLSASMQIVLKPQTTTATSLSSLLSYLETRVHLRVPENALVQLIMEFQGTFRRLIAGPSVGEMTDSESEQQARQQIAQWVQRKWLTPEDHSYVAEFSYQNKQFSINKTTINVKPEVSPQTIKQ